jgi:hypothetical protein
MSGFKFGNDGENEGDVVGGTGVDESFRDILTKRFGADKVEEVGLEGIEDEAAIVEGVEGDSTPIEQPEDVAGVEGSSPLPSASATDGDGFVIADEGDEAVATSTLTNDTTIPPSDELDLNDLFTKWNGGSKPDAAQITNLLGFIQQVSALSPAQQHMLNAVLSGEDIGNAAASGPAQVPQSSTSTPPQTSLLPDDLSPETRAILEPIVARQEALDSQLQTYQQQAHQQQIAAQQAQIQAGVQSASQQFVNEYKGILSQSDLILLESKTMHSGQFPLYLAQNNNDPVAAYRALLESQVYSDPELRTKVTSVMASRTQAQDLTDQTRIRKASAVAAGGSTNPAASTPAATKPLTAADKKRAAAEAIAQATGMTLMNK